MQLICVGRHRYLSGHIRRFFEALGLQVVATESLDEALRLVPSVAPDVALVDYELLASQPLSAWLADAAAREVPLLAVSLARRPEEMLLDRSVVVGSLYLPLLDAETAMSVLRHAASRGGVALPRGAAYPGRGARLTDQAPFNAPPG